MGNLDSKLTPYYTIIDENKSDTSILSKSSKDFYLNDLKSNQSSLWIIKKVNFNNDQKNSLLFEFNYAKYTLEQKKVSLKHIKLALNHIKALKTLRHPNIAKYLYSEEPQLNANNHITLNTKCFLITESLRPLTTIINDLSKEELIRGLYGITNAILFLHEKASLSHNNLNESAIYLNGKQTWKLSNFELALSFNDLNKENLKNIYEFKDKNSITPEENSSSDKSIDLDQIYKRYPHAIDSYCWAMLMQNLLPNLNQNKSLDEIKSNNSTTHIIENSYESEDYIINCLESYLSKDPSLRPSLKAAVNLSIFDSSRPYQISTSMTGMNDLESNELNFDLFKIQTLSQLDQDWSKLVDFLNELIQNNCKNNHVIKKSLIINEKLIDYLLSPIMFFSDKIKQFILPYVLIPNEEEKLNQTKLLNNKLTQINNFYLYKNWSINKSVFMMNDFNCVNDIDMKINELRPFIDLDKYKAFVIPRILNLFSMHSLQIRLVLLEYFPFYITLINDQDTLKYELLPELLLGLKDNNDQLVSLTFSALSIMVKLLGSELVVGKSNQHKSTKKNYFSDNIPKSIKHKESVTDFRSIFSKMSSSNSLDDEIMNMMLNSNEDTVLNTNKLFTDSMIALHDETSSISSINHLGYQSRKEEQIDQIEDNEQADSDWLNDFGWNKDNDDDQKSINISTNTNNMKLKINDESSASLASLAGSIKNDNTTNRVSNLLYNNNNSNNKSNNINSSNRHNDYIGAEFDIKNINIVKKIIRNDPNEDLIENYLNEIKPDIKLNSKKENIFNNKPDEILNEHIDSHRDRDKDKGNDKDKENEKKENLWDFDDEINLDEI